METENNTANQNWKEFGYLTEINCMVTFVCTPCTKFTSILMSYGYFCQSYVLAIDITIGQHEKKIAQYSTTSLTLIAARCIEWWKQGTLKESRLVIVYFVYVWSVVNSNCPNCLGCCYKLSKVAYSVFVWQLCVTSC